jgi:Domain of unknown function (DUF4188)
MAVVIEGRYTARIEEPFVVFIIGMRINKPLAVRKWLPTFLAISPMLRELYQHPEKGFLGAEFSSTSGDRSPCSTGAPSRISSASPGTPTIRTFPRGKGSTERWARTGASGSSTRRL